MPLRDIRLESGIGDQLERLGVTYKRFDAVMEGINDALAEHPQAFPVIPGTRVSLCKTNEFIGITFSDVPSLAIYFHYDDDVVRIISIDEDSSDSYGM